MRRKEEGGEEKERKATDKNLSEENSGQGRRGGVEMGEGRGKMKDWAPLTGESPSCWSLHMRLSPPTITRPLVYLY